MDALQERIRAIPPVTRYWLGGIVGSAALSTFSVVNKHSLTFATDKLSSQPWRMVTCFCYFGDFSVSFFISIAFLVGSSQVLESSYSWANETLPRLLTRGLDDRKKQLLFRHVERNATIDYLYFIGQICTSIVLLVTITHSFFQFRFLWLGPFLHEVLGYMWCRLNSDQEVNVFGLFSVTMSYLPFIYTVIQWVFSDVFLSQLKMVTEGNAVQLAKVLVRRASFWQLVIPYSIGHFWWFRRYYVLNSVYQDTNQSRVSRRKGSLEWLESPQQHNWLEEATLILLLPPWYWAIKHRLQAA